MRDYTFHPLGMVNPSYSMLATAFLKEPKMGGNNRMVSLAAFHVCSIFFTSPNVSFSPGFFLFITSTCSGKRQNKFSETNKLIANQTMF